jgi:hypothetical protein
VLLPRQASHWSAYEVDETPVPVVLNHAAQRQDHHRYRIWSWRYNALSNTNKQ